MRALGPTRAALALLLLLTLPVGRLSAQRLSDTPTDSAPKAIELGHQGVALYERGDWQLALERLREAEALYHSPVFVLYSARCLRNAGQLDEARETFAKLVGEQLEETAPAQWKQAQADGRVELAALEEMLAAVAARPPPVVDQDKPPTPAAPIVPPTEPRRAERRTYLSGLVLVGLGGAALIGGTVVGPLALHEENNALPDSCNGTTCPIAQKPVIERNFDKAQALGRSADALLIGGAVLAAVGVVLVLVARPEKASVNVAPAPGGAVMRGRF